ncbi:MAG: DUF1553 domain-containing protein [Planctomycetes bacterium]|nr:DUF1553 domain-containing protein [Planctomycetota bacterium]
MPTSQVRRSVRLAELCWIGAIVAGSVVVGNSAIAAERAIDFDTEIIPVLTKAGCNAGSCHGAAVGRGGFKLSLYGGDPIADYRAIVHELEGRRVNLARPKLSLLLQKSIEEISHGGGNPLDLDGPGAKRLLDWIKQGANRDGKRRLVAFELKPSLRIVAGESANVPLTATAKFNDGTTADVTRWTVFTPEDPAAVRVDAETAVARLRRRGEQIIIARFLDRVLPIRLIAPLSDTPVDHSSQPRRNFIDELVLKKLTTLRLPVSDFVDDAAFLRRVSLDLTGRLPTLAERSAFLADNRPGKHDRLIDRLLRSQGYVEYWTFQFAKLLRIRSQPRDTQGALTFHRWLKRQIKNGVPYNRIAAELLTALGDSHVVGPANFYRVAAGPRMQAEFVSELFLGVRLRCANCHNHPLDSWTQDDYHGFAAVFARIQRGRTVRLGTRGSVTHPRTGEPAIPRIPGVRFLTSPKDRADGRQAFADWLTHKNNPFFARAAVNRLWKAMMGRGLVEPVDDLRATNPATHPELLKRLAADFIENGYSLRHTLRRIARSSTYRRSRRPVAGRKVAGRKTGGVGNAADNRYYSRAIRRRLQAEVLADAIADVTGVSEKYGNQPAGTRAVTLFDPRIPSVSLDILGRCDRSGSCETGSAATGGLSQKLHLMNGALINRKITDPKGRLPRLIAAGRSDAEIVNELYRRALCRGPTTPEWTVINRQLAKAKDKTERRQILEDFLWSLLSSREFTHRQ